MKKLIAILLCLVMVVSMVACGGEKNPTPTDEKVITIGVFEPTSGQNGAGGKKEILGIQYANSLYPTVTIGGEEYKIELTYADNQSDSSKAPTAAQQLVSKGVTAVLGTYGSSCAIAGGPYFEQAKIPAIGTSCTNPQVTQGNDYYFRVCFIDPFQSVADAQFAKKQGVTKAAVITEAGDDYSAGLGTYFVKAFEALGGEVVEVNFQTGETDFSGTMASLASQGIEAIFAPTSIETAPFIIKQARDMGITARIMAGDTWENATIMENAGVENCEGVALSTFFDENDADASEFVQGFKAYLNSDAEALKLNGNNDTVAAVSALGYDAYMAIIEALKNVSGDITGEAVRDALASVSFDGVTGSISFDENGDANKDMAYIKIMSDGVFKFVGTQKTDGTFTPAA